MSKGSSFGFELFVWLFFRGEGGRKKETFLCDLLIIGWCSIYTSAVYTDIYLSIYYYFNIIQFRYQGHLVLPLYYTYNMSCFAYNIWFFKHDFDAACTSTYGQIIICLFIFLHIYLSMYLFSSDPFYVLLHISGKLLLYGLLLDL